MGSTERLGTGVNIQTRLAALHHLDAAWRPADIEQREGRIVGPGNQFEQVEVLRRTRPRLRRSGGFGNTASYNSE